MLIDLLKLASTADPTLVASLAPMVQILEDYAVKFRYPGFDATRAQARTALESLRRVRRTIRGHLGL